MKNDIIYFFSQSWAVFFKHRNNLTPQHQVVGQVIEISVIWAFGNNLGKQPGTWFLGRGPVPRNNETKLRGTQMEGKLLKKLFQSSCMLSSSKEAGLFSFLLLKACFTEQMPVNSIDIYWALTSAACAKALGLQMCKSWGPALKRLKPEGRQPSSARVAATMRQYSLGTAAFDLAWKWRGLSRPERRKEGVLDGMNSRCKSTEASKLLGLFGN